MEIKELTNLPLILFFLCPGVVFVYSASWFTVGQLPQINKDTVGGLMALSVVYAVCAAALGFIPRSLISNSSLTPMSDSIERWFVFAYTVGLPFSAGILGGVIKRYEIPFKTARILRLNPMHPHPTAWLTAFSRIRGGEFIVVTLKDGTTISGYFEGRSSISSQMSFPDLYLEETLPPPGQAPNVVRGTWIAPGEIKLIEIVSQRPNWQHIPPENINAADQQLQADSKET